jgi:hypothetical protein
MNVGNTTASVVTQHIKQADTAKEQLGTQTVPHLAFLEKQSADHVQKILEQVVPKEKPVRMDKDAKQKEKRTLRYTVKGKKVTAIEEPRIDTMI